MRLDRLRAVLRLRLLQSIMREITIVKANFKRVLSSPVADTGLHHYQINENIKKSMSKLLLVQELRFPTFIVQCFRYSRIYRVLPRFFCPSQMRNDSHEFSKMKKLFRSLQPSSAFTFLCIDYRSKPYATLADDTELTGTLDLVNDFGRFALWPPS